MPIEPIDDPKDPRLADYHELREPELRRKRGLFAVEGRLLVERLLTASRFRARSVLATPGMATALAPALEAAAVPAWIASHDLIRAVVGFPFHRGAVALGERGEPMPVDTLLDARTLVVLEGLADPENVGGVMRSARALGAGGILMAPGVADPLGRKAIRVSAGAALSLPFVGATGWPDELARVRAAGFTLLALTPDRHAGEISSVPLPSDARVALLVGAEGEGLSAAARALADVEIRIAMAPGVDSLNVVVAAGIALHHLRTRLH
ncbi:MAG: RNA methyltransferase [Candidatus Rokubacteria bacterium]|nr:RNA methyltransferase [Candidatus Rokubacteria bacterium]